VHPVVFIIHTPPVALQPDSRPPLMGIRDHTHWTHQTRYDSSGRVISPSPRPLPANTQHSKETNIHAPTGIRTRNPSKTAAADPLLRSRDHRDQHLNLPRGSKFKTDKISTKQETVLQNKDIKRYFNALEAKWQFLALYRLP